MTDRKRVLLWGMNQLSLTLLLYLIYSPFSNNFSWEELGRVSISYILISFLSVIIFSFSEFSFLIKYALIASLTFFVLWIVTSSLLFSIIFSLFMALCSVKNWDDELESDLEIVSVLSILVVIPYIFFMKQKLYILFGITYLQLIFMVGKKTVIYFTKHNQDKKVWKDFSVPFCVFIIGVFGFTIMKPIKKLYVLLVDVFSYVVYYILYIPLWFVFTYIIIPLINLFKKDYLPPETSGEADGAAMIISEGSLKIPAAFYWVCITLLILMILFLIYRKRVNRVSKGNITSLNIHPELQNVNSKKKKWLYSKDRTRKKFLQFEKKMDKKGLGRLRGESPSIWFKRLNLSGFEADVVLKGYEHVRYGEKKLEKKELSHYMLAFNQLETQLRHRKDSTV